MSPNYLVFKSLLVSRALYLPGRRTHKHEGRRTSGRTPVPPRAPGPENRAENGVYDGRLSGTFKPLGAAPRVPCGSAGAGIVSTAEVMHMRKSLTLGAGLILILAACASPPQQPAQNVAKAQKPAVGCVPDTATRLPMKDSECAGFGATHSSKDLQNTGQPYADQQLRMLDPALWGGGH